MTPAFAALAVAALAVAALLLAACGGDDESRDKTATAQTDSAPATATETEATETVGVPTEETETGAQTSTSPEDQPGGAGDEEPAQSQALFSGRSGRIRPTVIRVPAYISIRVELRSADGREYALRFGNRTLRSGGAASFAGLRPGKALVGEPVGGGNRVRVEATAEPGP